MDGRIIKEDGRIIKEDIAKRLDNRLKSEILRKCIYRDYCISDLSKLLGASIPTVTKNLMELIYDGFMTDLGKQDTSGGRRPSIYGLDGRAGFLVGIDVMREQYNMVVTDFRGKIIDTFEWCKYDLKDRLESVRGFCATIRATLEEHGYVSEEILAYGIDLTGRVNPTTGISYSYDLGDRPIKDVLEEELGAICHIDNDSRAMTFGEWMCGGLAGKVKDMIFINVGWGLGMGMILDGSIYCGKSGFSGEIGHFPFLDNNQICQCGKIGCLETGCSGSAILGEVKEALNAGRASMLSAKYKAGEELTFDDLIEAIKAEDVVAIEKTEEGGQILGRAIAGLINIFNPELVVIGGRLSAAKGYIMDPIMSGIKRYALNLITRDTKVCYSSLMDKAGPMGAAMEARSSLLGIL